MKVTDEQIISELLAHGNKKAVAAVLGMSEQQIYQRTNTTAFKAKFAAIHADLLACAVGRMADALTLAIQTACDIMKNMQNMQNMQIK
mgnify:CR=1 FL=1